MKRIAGKSLRRSLLILLLIVSGSLYARERPIDGLLDYTLEVSFDIQASILKGVATIPVKKGQEIRFSKGELRLLYAVLDQEHLDISEQKGTLRILSSREGKIEIGYEGVFTGTPSGNYGVEPASVVSDKGIFLTGTWYPKPDQMCHYHLTAMLPDGYEAISEAETVEKFTSEGRTVFTFDFPHPLDSIDLIASSRYKIVQDHFDGVEIFAYLFPEDADLIKTYIDHAKRYIQVYDRLISKFPYKRFSIVENFLATGYSMPTFTLLGQEVVRLPFIPETSLGHEILHQWFGNLVYIDYDKGNWAEGLTTFLADYLYEEEKHRGIEYRKGALIDYQSYVNDRNEFPLRDFRERTDGASQAIGYGKALMVFQMLKSMVGEERFYESIRYFVAEMRWRKASWNDIQRAFEKYYHEDLAWFFTQWVDGKGFPEILLEDVAIRPLGANFEVAFTVTQMKKAYTLWLPVTIYFSGARAKRLLPLRKEKERFEVIVEDLPERMAIDENYEVARGLSLSEFPPVIARLLGVEKTIIALSPSGPEIYDEVIKTFRERGSAASGPGRITFEELKAHSLVILGADNPMVGRLYGSLAAQGGFSVVIKENPWNRWKVAGIIDARSKEEIRAAFQKIFHYGKYSVLSFDHGANVFKRTDESGRGITKGLYKEPAAVDLSTLGTLQGVIDRVAGKKIVYVGETHDEFPDHVMELEIIKGLHRRGEKIAIGMEMFQRPFQRVVDEYIEGKVDEATFLKGTEYFKRWGFDYHLYRPILLFARAERIPVVALNQRQEIVDKVFQGGLDGLPEEEKKSVPSQMDFSDDAYRERLKKIFSEHKDSKSENFDFFYQAQIVWDETMAESVDQFLRAHPDNQMVVLAGSGHLEYGSGIPKRVARRNGYDYGIILNNDVDLEKGIADFVLFPGTIPGVTSPMLMVFLREEAGRVEIAGFPRNSVSEKAGMKVGDIILSIDHTSIHTVDDVKIDLLDRKKGDKMKVRVLRKGLWGSKGMDFNVVLQ
jgi:aminopeptidase N